MVYRRIILIILFFLVFSFVFLPKNTLLFAQYGPHGDCSSPNPCKGGIVPCGRTCDDDSTPNDECAHCNLCHVFILIQRVISTLLVPLAIALVGLMAMVAGVLFITASGDPGRIMQARKTITAAVIGLVIVLLSWTIINTIIAFATNNTQNGIGIIFGQKWNEINCTVP
jgi:hypothetical protein